MLGERVNEFRVSGQRLMYKCEFMTHFCFDEWENGETEQCVIIDLADTRRTEL